MTDDSVIAICAAVVAIAFIGLVALRVWVDYKLDLVVKKEKK